MDANIVKVNAKSTLYFILRPYSGKKKKKKKKQVKLAFCFGRGQRQPLFVATKMLLAGLETSPDVVNGVFFRFRECKFPPNTTY